MSTTRAFDTGFRAYDVIDVRQPPTTVIDRIAECENIVSSSLHGVIIAEVFGVKARWARFSDRPDWRHFQVPEIFICSVGISDVRSVGSGPDRTASQHLS